MADVFRELADGLRKAAQHDWRAKARPAQLPPLAYAIWMILTGRGWGKNFTAGNTTIEQVVAGAVRRIALVGPTWDHVRQTMVEGNSGILALSPSWCRPAFESSKNQLTWPNGCIATMYSDASPEALRGPEHDFAWCDEIASWRSPDTWSNLLLTLRIGTQPRIIVTSTPKPTKLIRDLVAREGKDGVVITRGSTYDNRQNLSRPFLETLVRRYEGTRTGRQELLGELLEDVPGALWNRENLEATRVERAPSLQRIVIGVDPAGSTEAGADLTGIIACGVGHDGHLYVLADASCRGSPREWASRVSGLYRSLAADKVVIEKNFGGAMAAATLMSVDPALPVKEITSSRGKVLRAEPISSLFEQSRGHIVGMLEELETQACAFTADWDRARDGSPDRVDAMVFAASELMLSAATGGYFKASSLLVDGEPVPVPFRPRQVFAVGAASAGQDAFGVLYLARMHADFKYSLVVLDWDYVAVDEALFAGPWLAGVIERQKAFEALEPTPSLWICEEGIGTALLRQGSDAGLSMWSIDQHLELPADLATLVSDVSAQIHGGEVKASAEAYGKHLTYAGVTRNHFLAHLESYRVASEELPDCALLRALSAAIILASPTEVRRKRHRRAAA